MILEELIAFLEQQDPALVLPEGFHRPHSYRGYYEELAFEPAQNITVGAMLKAARSAVGTTYSGYKGGEYTMGQYSDVYLAYWGDTGEPLSLTTLKHMIAAPEIAQLRADLDRAERHAAELAQGLVAAEEENARLRAALATCADERDRLYSILQDPHCQIVSDAGVALLARLREQKEGTE